MRIGLDFDNTLAGYDGVFAVAGRALGVLPTDFHGGKTEVKAYCHSLPDGEAIWMGLQGQVYGAHMAEARLIDGVAPFLHRARALGAELVVVSHKTEFGHFDPQRVNLRHAARAWMEAQKFFDADGFGLRPQDVYFETTRREKVERIAALALDHFVDDLPEVFAEPGFPAHVRRHLFTNGRAETGENCEPFRHWDDLTARLLP